MLNIYIDTALLAVPNYATDQSTAQELIERLTHLSLVCSMDTGVRVVISDDLEEKLLSSFPTFDDIAEFLKLMSLSQDYTSYDLLRIYQTILSRAARAEDVSIDEVEELQSFSTNPNLPESLFPTSLRSETERIFATVALQRNPAEVWRVGSSLAGSDEQHYDVNATVQSFRRCSSGLASGHQLARRLTASSHLSNLVTVRAASELWSAALSQEDFYLSLAFGALAISRQRDRSAQLSDLKNFAIGTAFIESLHREQSCASQKFSMLTFETCASLIAGQCRKTVKPMGRPKQEIRLEDGSSAWRVQLTKGAVGLRLMFWKDASTLEFANVGSKFELSIKPGVLHSRRQLSLEDVLL